MIEYEIGQMEVSVLPLIFREDEVISCYIIQARPADGYNGT